MPKIKSLVPGPAYVEVRFADTPNTVDLLPIRHPNFAAIIQLLSEVAAKQMDVTVEKAEWKDFGPDVNIPAGQQDTVVIRSITITYS